MVHYIHYRNGATKQLNVLLPGSSMGFQTGLISKIFNRFVQEGLSTVSFNYPFLDRGEENSSGPELKEEIKMLKEVMQDIGIDSYERVNFIGKSLGGIVAAHFLARQGNQRWLKNFSLSILGYVKGSINLEGISCPTIIIQGQNDRYGDIEQVKNDFQAKDHTHIQFVEIASADHSYRDQEKRPVFEEEAIEALFNFIISLKP